MVANPSPHFGREFEPMPDSLLLKFIAFSRDKDKLDVARAYPLARLKRSLSTGARLVKCTRIVLERPESLKWRHCVCLR